MSVTLASASTQYLNCASSLAFAQNMAGVTAMAWVRSSSHTTNDRVILYWSNNATNAGRVTLSLTTTSFMRAACRRLDADGSVSFNGATTINDGTLYHVAVVCFYTGASCILYVNGASDGSSSPAGWTGNSSNTASAGARIGGRVDNGAGFWDGTIGDVRLYQRALSAQEVENIYRARGSDRIINGKFEHWRMLGGAPTTTVGTVPSIGSNQGGAVSSGSPTFGELLAHTRSNKVVA